MPNLNENQFVIDFRDFTDDERKEIEQALYNAGYFLSICCQTLLSTEFAFKNNEGWDGYCYDCASSNYLGE